MFNGGRPDPMTLWIVDQEERKNDLERVARFIKLHYSYGAIDIDDVAAECGVTNLTPAECDYIEKRINER
jgi:AcrR family transcriptional regulator